MKAVDEKVLRDAFVEMFNELKIDKEKFFNTLIENIRKVIQNNGYNKEIDKLETKITETKNELNNLVKIQTSGKIDGEIYNEEYLITSNKYKEAKLEFERVEERKIHLNKG